MTRQASSPVTAPTGPPVTCCDYADQPWHERLLRLEDNLGAATEALEWVEKAFEGHNLLDFVRRHDWGNGQGVTRFAASVDDLADFVTRRGERQGASTTDPLAPATVAEEIERFDALLREEGQPEVAALDALLFGEVFERLGGDDAAKLLCIRISDAATYMACKRAEQAIDHVVVCYYDDDGGLEQFRTVRRTELFPPKVHAATVES